MIIYLFSTLVFRSHQKPNTVYADFGKCDLLAVECGAVKVDPFSRTGLGRP